MSAPAVTLLVGIGCLIVLIAITAAVRLLCSATAAERHISTAMAFSSSAALRPMAKFSSSPPTPAPAPAAAREFANRTVQPASDSAAADLSTQQSGDSSDAAAQLIFAQLNEYYAANISQGNAIFWASLLSICIGFAIIFTGIVSAGGNAVTAIVAAIAGVLSQFIAATFLVVLRSTQQQATTYAQSLVELHLRDIARSTDRQGVALGLQLLNEISSDRSNPANATKALIASGLIVKQTELAGRAAGDLSRPADSRTGRRATQSQRYSDVRRRRDDRAPLSGLRNQRERLGQELVRAQPRRVIGRDGDDHRLVRPMRFNQRFDSRPDRRR